MKKYITNLQVQVFILVALAFVATPLRAQTTNAKPATKPDGAPHYSEYTGYTVQVEDGNLLLDGLGERLDVNQLFPHKAGESIHKVPATLANYVILMSALDRSSKIVLDPVLDEKPIHDFRLAIPANSESFQAANNSLANASGYQFNSGFTPKKYVIFSRYEQQRNRNFEVFNLSGYFSYLTFKDMHVANPPKVEARLEEIKQLVVATITELDNRNPQITFDFHPGTELLVVIGTSNDISVAKKIINALPGVVQTVDPATGLPVTK